ncbi:flagellar protein FlgN [Candidatus Arthromitus sp. SFB-turkey]|uniref:flagellar protein FlgN n=1 Tax=Candidatus Arthromitus sp. SFB-turkey TaxID=1840217 RepID=UPI0007F53E12|nr:flagellar protein FlgN [Candidatus Arthromitus sp. SFB-turkey]OAT89690.1 flagellar biosynthesis protein FlgN [Candidatus Arthromitus sp. SFB-turkey]
MKKEVNNMLIDQIKLFNVLQDDLEKQKDCVKNNKLFELDSIGIKINSVCKNIAEIEIKLRNLLGKQTIKEFVMENKDDEELYGSYIFLVSQVERLSLIKNDNQFLIKKSLTFINKLLSSINNNTNQCNVYTRKMSY